MPKPQNITENPSPPPSTPGPENFPTTSWSVIQKMADTDPETARQALGSLLQRYWYPLYAYIRSKHQCIHQDAEDITQALMIHLLSKSEVISRVDPSRGSLRDYLHGCANNFALKSWEKRTAAKRDIRKTIPWDSLTAKERYENEPANYLDPTRLFARRWALTLLDATFEKLRAHYKEGTVPFEALRPFLRLEGNPSDTQLASLAERHRTTEGALRVRIHRLRTRWRQLILSEIKQTLNNPTDEAARAEFEELLGSL